MSNRRDLWRDFMGCFEPSADPRDAVERGFYVPRPGRSLAEQLAARFELKPSASHLLMGGVGSGKTTQLLVARDRLAGTGDTNAVYVDVSFRANLSSMTSLDLLAIAGLALGEMLDAPTTTPQIESALTWFDHCLSGAGEWPDDSFERVAYEIKRIHAQLVGARPQQVLLLDSLDRMSDLKRFADLIEGAVAELRSLGIGIILIGPVAALYGIRRTALDRFDRTWHLPTVDAQNDAEGHSFLLQVLRARDKNELLSAAAAERLAKLSGGVLRDLISLTQAAGEEAYVDGADRVEIEHVETAADIFGRKHLFAIDSQQLAVLQHVRAKGTFVQTSEKELALLTTRRVLEYTNGHAHFSVHPTIDRLLAEIPEVP